MINYVFIANIFLNRDHKIDVSLYQGQGVLPYIVPTQRV